MQTSAIVVHPSGHLRREVVDLGEPRADEAIVSVRYGGICGSDIHYWKHGRVGSSVLRDPLVLGHEIVGTVVTSAADGTGPGAGADVFVHPATACGECLSCRGGRRNICERVRYMGSAAFRPHTQGGFADHLRVPASRLLSLDGLPLRLAALIEPASVAWHAVSRALDAAGPNGRANRLAVIGAGPIGLLCIATLRARWPEASVVACDLQRGALEAALGVGATEARTPDELARRHEADRFDVVVESSGTESGITAALRLARDGGTVVVVGQLPERVGAPFQLVVTRELTVAGSSRFSHEAGEVIDGLRGGFLDVGTIVRHVFPARDYRAAFDVAADSAEPGKVLLQFSADDDRQASGWPGATA